MTMPTWTLTGHLARATQHDACGTVDLDEPQGGIAIESNRGGAGDHLLGLDLRSECRLAEHWIRGRDVTAVYEPGDARRLRATAMWRLAAATAESTDRRVAAWELVVSAQTSLLESDPTLAVVSSVAATDIRPLESNGLLARRDDGSSVVVIVHPDDLRTIEFEQQGPRATICCELFSSAVEKGVLLRSRVLAAIGPSADDTAWAAALARSFAASPPMLTT
jgi:hypothetical protein